MSTSIKLDGQVLEVSKFIVSHSLNFFLLSVVDAYYIEQTMDANSDGQLSKAELLAALKALPRSKPKTMPPGAKFMSVDAMIEAMDADSDGSIDLSEWLDNLHKCAGLVAALAENVNADGLLESYKPEEQRHSVSG